MRRILAWLCLFIHALGSDFNVTLPPYLTPPQLNLGKLNSTLSGTCQASDDLEIIDLGFKVVMYVRLHALEQRLDSTNVGLYFISSGRDTTTVAVVLTPKSDSNDTTTLVGELSRPLMQRTRIKAYLNM